VLPSPPAFAPGYLIYVAGVLIPGIGLAELLGVTAPESGLAEKLGYAVGLGFAFDTLVLMVKASGLTVFGYRLIGVDTDVVYLLIFAGVATLLISLAVRREFSFLCRPTRVEAILLLAILVQSATIVFFFEKYPIFPAYPSQDFRNHADEALGLISGGLTMLPGGAMYYAAIGQIALSIVSVGGLALSTAERTMAIVAILSPLLVYLAGLRLFSHRMVSVLAACLYTLSGTVWYIPVFDSGLYPNFFGILASLFMFVAYVDMTRGEGGVRRWAVFFLALVMFYMSHFSVVALLPAFVLIPIYQLLKARSELRRYILPTILLVTPAVLAAILLPGLYPMVIALIESGRGNFISLSYLGGVFSGIPVLGYMAGELNDDVEFVVLMFLLAVYVVKFRKGGSLLIFPIAWFFTLMFAPFNSSAWRFAFEAIMPLLFMAAFAIHSLTVERRKAGKKRLRTNISKGWKTGIIVGLLVMSILLNSWVPQSVADSLTYTSLVNMSQNAVYNATVWIAQRTPPNATFLSLTDWHFSYLNKTIGRAIAFSYFSDPNAALAYARRIGASYIIITFVVTIILPADAPNLYPWNTFPGNTSLSLAYSNSDVRIYKVG
jgi:hypothetical protein